MSIADTQRTKELERRVDELEARLLLLEMQKRPVEAVAQRLLDCAALASTPIRRTLTLRGRA